ncbi:hypothetical protein AKJ16_DCAP16471 [Drosera capensis]
MAKGNSVQRSAQMINWVEEAAPPQLIIPQQRSSGSPKLDTILEEDNNGNKSQAKGEALSKRTMASRLRSMRSFKANW